VVYFPAGSYRAQALPVYSGVTYMGAGPGASKIGLLGAATTDHLFKIGSGTFARLGWVGLELVGGGTLLYDGINLSAATQVSHFVIRDCDINGFRRGYSGSLDDRWGPVHNTRFWNCETGAHVVNNHPTFVDCDFRLNTTGIGGAVLYDSQITACRFAYNTNGIVVTALDYCNITGNLFYLNSAVNVRVRFGCTVTGNRFVSAGAGADVGVDAVGYSNTINGNHFDDAGSPGWLAAVRVGAVTNVVSGNAFNCSGKAVVFDASTGIVLYTSIHGNTFRGLAQPISVAGAFNVYYNTVSDNVFQFTGNIGTDALVAIPNTLGVGNVFTGNMARNEGTCGAWLSTDGRATIVTNNRLRQAGITLTATDADTINTNTVVT
jgi:hypothetical protein